MLSKFRIVLFILFFPLHSYAQVQPVFEWGHGIGGIQDDVGREIVIDHNRNVIVLCNFGDTVDFDPSPTGVTNLIGCGYPQIAFAKYDSSGNLIWAKSLCGNQGNGLPLAMDIDDDDNIYITGNFHLTTDFDPGPGVANLSTSIGSDMFLAKYDSSGNYIWAHNIGGNENYNVGSDVTVDNSGAVYVTGYFQDTVDFDPGPGISTLISIGDGDFYLVKFDVNGIFQWVLSAGSNNIDHDTWGIGLATDDQGNIYCTGFLNGNVDFDPGPGTTTTTPGGPKDIFIVKYNSVGNFKWLRHVGGSGIDEGRGIAVSPAGNVCIAGEFSDTVDFDPGPGISNGICQGMEDIFLLQLDSSGNFNWAVQTGDVMWDRALGIATDALNNVYITGFFQGNADFDPGPGTLSLSSTGVRDVFMAKFNSSGVPVWARCFGGPSTEYGFNISVDEFNDVYVIGHFAITADLDPDSAVASVTSNGAFDMFFAKYNQNVSIGLDENMSSNDNFYFTVYPNPFNSQTNAELHNSNSGEVGLWKLTLFDLAGKEIIKYESNQTQLTIERGNLQPGLYFYKVESKHEIFKSGKIVIID